MKRKIMLVVDSILYLLFAVGTIYSLYHKEYINAFFTLSMALLFWFSGYSHREEIK